ncbi:unnamed protein product, partial [Larinioides sclopetarius]
AINVKKAKRPKPWERNPETSASMKQILEYSTHLKKESQHCLDEESWASSGNFIKC